MNKLSLQNALPLLLILALAAAALPLVPSSSTWLTLTVAGLAMGMMIFMMASGLTLVFGLMDVMNFAHGAFISVGAYAGASVLLAMKPAMQAQSLGANLSAIVPGVIAAMVLAGALGWFFERVVVRPVYGDHLKQILVTTGGLIVCEQLIHVVWGPDLIPLPRPATLTGSFLIGDAAIERYRMLAVVVGLGGVMWAMYQESLTAGMGMQVMVVIFIVIIIGGLGSVGGCFVGALLVGLIANYIGYVAPKLALGSNILLMVLILLWRPRGLYPVGK